MKNTYSIKSYRKSSSGCGAIAMVSRLGFLCLLLALSVSVQAQTQVPADIIVLGNGGEEGFSYKADIVDPVMKQIPREIQGQRQNVTEFLRLLAGYINEKADGDYDRVKKAHDWVALNIRYDAQAYYSRHIPTQDYTAVIRRGLAVCAGYAEAFKALCDALEIECQIVSGFARGASRGLFRNENVMDSNHAWNIVTIEGKNYLIDCTWDSGYLNGRSFQAKYKTEYLFADPAHFIYDHFPYFSRNQLLDTPVTAEEFTRLPFLSPLFFQAVETWPDLDRITEISAGEDITFEFTLKPGYEISYAWYTEAGARRGNSMRPGRSDVYKISPPRLPPGRYYLEIFITKPGERTGVGCAEFGFVVK